MSTKVRSVLKNSGIAFGILGIATAFCFLVQRISESDTHVPLLFVLAVLFVSRFTDGYVYGIVASIIAVFGVNYVFTFPYFKLNFAITGYPLTFVAMLAVACSVSALTTQIKKQEQMRLEVEREKMRANLLRAVSHDIRTPLTSIVGSASGIIDNYDALSKENILELLEDMKSEGQWLVRMVENLLSITRIGDGTARIDKEDELVEDVISGAITKFRKRFPDIEVVPKVPEDVLFVPMDAILIEQVIVNLLENCVLHADGMTKIWLIVTEDGDQVKFSVEDDGAGIKESALPRMFDGSFQSEDGKESDSKRNMGIGLSVCMTIVRAHDGIMKAENRKEGGARVMFWTRNMEIKDRVLVVEDDKRISNFIKTVLEANNYDVIVAQTGAEAYSMVTSQCPDVVILDLGLPDMDGMKILQGVREWSAMPVIVVSARTHERDKVEALDLGADDYITKPFGTSELLARIRTAIRHTRSGIPNQPGGQTGVFKSGGLTIDYDKHRVFIDGVDAGLTQNEYKIVSLLGKYAGKVMTYDYIIKEIWGPNMKNDNRILRVNMANIRRKIEKNPAEPQYIFTEVGVGYRIVEPD